MAGPGKALAPPRAILFDWDNTLVDTWEVIHDATNHTLSAMGEETWTLDQTKARVRKSAREAFPERFGDRWPEAERIFFDRFREIHLDLLLPSAGAEALLRSLNRAGIYCGVVSNKTGPFLRAEAAHLGWRRYFGRLVGAKDAEKDKPAREPVDLALDGSGVAAGPDTWFVGDTDVDLECARNAGCVPVLLRPDPPRTGEFTASPPAVHVRNCRDLRHTLENLWTLRTQSA